MATGNTNNNQAAAAEQQQQQMWLSEELVYTIGRYLDVGSTGRLRSASTLCNTSLRYPHTLQKMARDVIEERKRHQPLLDSSRYTMTIRDEFLLRFADLDPETDMGPMALFRVEVVYGKHLLINVAYAWNEGAFTESQGHLQATIVPSSSLSSSLSSDGGGSAELDDFENPPRLIEYTGGFDPLLALQWCQLHM